jgi:hypothetical protein
MAVLRTNGSRGTAGRNVAANYFIALMCLVFSLATPMAASAAPVESREFQIKAVFLFNFAQFVEWPPDAFSDPTSPLVIGILGNDPFGPYLDEAVRGEKVNERSIVIVRFARIEDVAKCHILFISQSEAGRLEQDLASLKGKDVLTVSDLDDFSSLGGMIRFVTEKNKVRLRINNGAARAEGLRISSKLLRPSEVVSMR